ncbi:hypothetical protein [Haliea sp. E17]|uniref:hypothetical protein n=1 Tax=Haliea sp. E17 TaxID=3401576 RepID=UPI003AB037F6
MEEFNQCVEDFCRWSSNDKNEDIWVCSKERLGSCCQEAGSSCETGCPRDPSARQFNSCAKLCLSATKKCSAGQFILQEVPPAEPNEPAEGRSFQIPGVEYEAVRRP